MSTGQIPAEFAMPKPDTNMAEASEEADKMETDGQNQESGAGEQKQEDGSTPIEEVQSKCLMSIFASYILYNNTMVLYDLI